MKAEMQRYGHYEVLVVDSVLKIVSSTLGVIYAIDYMGREYHCRLLQIAINVIDCAAPAYTTIWKNMFFSCLLCLLTFLYIPGLRLWL